eukprot:677664-Alexandrium_andersonii.AAC.1
MGPGVGKLFCRSSTWLVPFDVAREEQAQPVRQRRQPLGSCSKPNDGKIGPPCPMARLQVRGVDHRAAGVKLDARTPSHAPHQVDRSARPIHHQRHADPN